MEKKTKSNPQKNSMYVIESIRELKLFLPWHDVLHTRTSQAFNPSPAYLYSKQHKKNCWKSLVMKVVLC